MYPKPGWPHSSIFFQILLMNEIFSLVFEAACSSSVLWKHLKILIGTSWKTHLSICQWTLCVLNGERLDEQQQWRFCWFLAIWSSHISRSRSLVTDSSACVFPSSALFTQASPTFHGYFWDFDYRVHFLVQTLTKVKVYFLVLVL